MHTRFSMRFWACRVSGGVDEPYLIECWIHERFIRMIIVKSLRTSGFGFEMEWRGRMLDCIYTFAYLVKCSFRTTHMATYPLAPETRTLDPFLTIVFEDECSDCHGNHGIAWRFASFVSSTSIHYTCTHKLHTITLSDTSVRDKIPYTQSHAKHQNSQDMHGSLSENLPSSWRRPSFEPAMSTSSLSSMKYKQILPGQDCCSHPIQTSCCPMILSKTSWWPQNDTTLSLDGSSNRTFPLGNHWPL